MDITPPVAADRQLIQGYGDGGFRISGVRHEGSLLLAPSKVWPLAVAEIGALDAAALQPLRDGEDPVEILLFGCGDTMAFIDDGLRRDVRAWGAVIDPMNTGAACRTYNVLLAEGRAVAAVLIAV